MTEGAQQERRDPAAQKRDIDRYIEATVNTEIDKLEKVLGDEIKSLDVLFQGYVDSAKLELRVTLENGLKLVDERLSAENVPTRLKALEAKPHWWETKLAVTCIVVSGFAALGVSLAYDLRIRGLLIVLGLL